MQNRLIELGYLVGKATAKFDNGTEAAVIAFQRRNTRYADGVAGPKTYARLAAEKAPEFYIVWETLGTVLMDAGKDAAEAENCIAKAIELQKKSGAKVEDVRMYVSLARAQLLRGDKKAARLSVRKVRPRVSELNDFERGEFEEIEKRVK